MVKTSFLPLIVNQQMCLAPLGRREGVSPPLLRAPQVIKIFPFTGEKTEALKDKVASSRKVPQPAILRSLLFTAHTYLKLTP